jgi:hypothetical protein
MHHVDFRTRQVLADLAQAIAVTPAGDDLVGAAQRLRQAVAMAPETGDLTELWPMQADRFRRARAPVRAALMNAVARLQRGGQLPEGIAPTPEDLRSEPLTAIAPRLLALARTLDPAAIAHIARADYGHDADRHRQALVALLADPAMAYPPGDRWFPAEVVELVSHIPGQPGHVQCLAIVVLDALRDGDRHGNAVYRLENQYAEIARLPPSAREPLYAGFRHLYEDAPHWSPSIPAPFVLPWASRP